MTIDPAAPVAIDPARMADGGDAGAWEGVAFAVLSETGVDAPVDAFELADCCGLRMEPGARGTACLAGETVRYDITARLVRQHGMIAHETAHYVLRLHAVDDTEEAARYTAGALMLPRAAFDRDLRATAWDLERLCALHPNASAEMTARRITQLRDAVVSVLDQGKLRARVASPWIEQPRPRLTAIERELADAALESGEVRRANDLLAAYPLFDGPHRRVIVVAEAQQLGMRF